MTKANQMTTEQFDKALSSAVGFDEKLRDMTQKLCLQAVMQSALHGNTEFCQKMFRAFNGSKSIKASKIMDYLVEWAPVTLDKKSGFSYDRDSENVIGTDVTRLADVMKAMHAKPWYEYAKSSEVKAVDIIKVLTNAVKAVERAVEAEVTCDNLPHLLIAINAINNAAGKEVVALPKLKKDVNRTLSIDEIV